MLHLRGWPAVGWGVPVRVGGRVGGRGGGRARGHAAARGANELRQEAEWEALRNHEVTAPTQRACREAKRLPSQDSGCNGTPANLPNKSNTHLSHPLKQNRTLHKTTNNMPIY